MVSDRYYYSKLSVYQQLLYKKIYDAVIRYDEYIICGENDYTEEDLEKILNAVIMDNSDIFYIKNTIDVEKTSWGLIKLYPQYYFEKKDKEQVVAELEKNIHQLFSSADIDKKDPEEIAKDVHDILIKRTLVEKGVEAYASKKCAVVETLLENKMTAHGGAYTYKYLLNSKGIKCNVIYGTFLSADNEVNSRTWNCINMYGENRYIDIFEDAGKSNDQKVCYEYFGVTNEVFFRDHSITGALLSTVEEKSDVEIENEIHLDFCQVNEKKNDFLNIVSANLINVYGIIGALEDILSVLRQDNVRILIEKLIRQLEALKEIENQYPDEKDLLENGIITPFQDLLRILQEYYRYKKCLASSNLIDILYDKLSVIIDILIKAIQYNMNLFWSHHTNEIISDMSEIQQNLIDEKKNRKLCPIDINSLNEQSDINDFIVVLQYLKIYSLPQKISEQITQILDGLNRLQDVMSRNSNKTISISNFQNYYLPESIRLIFLYDKYEDEGVSEEKLEDLYENIQLSLFAVNKAINLRLDEIYTFETMETKARAKALADIIGQDGYIINNDFFKNKN